MLGTGQSNVQNGFQTKSAGKESIFLGSGDDVVSEMGNGPALQVDGSLLMCEKDLRITEYIITFFCERGPTVPHGRVSGIFEEYTL